MKPIYSIAHPDYEVIGAMIDRVIKDHFYGRSIAVRYLSLQDHPSKSTEDLMSIIQKTGTDRYDPARRMAVAHEFYTDRGVDIFAVPADVDACLDISTETLRDFAKGALQDRGYSLRIGLIVIYDRRELEKIPIQYDDGVGEDAFRFKNPVHKADAVLGFIRVAS